MICTINNVIEKLEEETTQGNITYVPGGFGNIGKVLKVLSRMKKAWNIEILEDENSKEVMFGKDLKVIVDNKNWESFMYDLKDFGLSNKLKMSSNVIEEAREEEVIGRLFSEIEKEIRKLIRISPIKDVKNSIDIWVKNFGVRSYSEEDFLLKYSNLGRSISDFLKVLKFDYKSDRGTLELILEALNKKLPLSTFEPFQDYDYLFGTLAISNPEKVNIRMLFAVSLSNNVIETMKTRDKDLLEKLTDEGSVKVDVKTGTVTPKGGKFKDEFFINLKGILEEI